MAECADAQDPSVKESRFTRVLDYHGDLAEFQELFPILEDAYHDLDAVLEETGLATMDIPTEDVHIREGVGGKYLEFFANKVLPYGLSATTEAAWDHFKGLEKHCGNGELYEKAARVRWTNGANFIRITRDLVGVLVDAFCFCVLESGPALHNHRGLYKRSLLQQLSCRYVDEADRAALRGAESGCRDLRLSRKSHRDQTQGYRRVDVPSSKLRHHQTSSSFHSRSRAVAPAVLLADLDRQGAWGGV